MISDARNAGRTARLRGDRLAHRAKVGNLLKVLKKVGQARLNGPFVEATERTLGP